MITFNVVDRDGDQKDVKPQACIFKVLNIKKPYSVNDTNDLSKRWAECFLE
ncbi:hypothetical protein CASFOL_028879 [Castilleja foliolosa]|uniref:Uncharacterized protein n=1 Tax=Castilleja foliolosa TaxID=1961234 RepID=A0ABD3CCH3_9LAMI